MLKLSRLCGVEVITAIKADNIMKKGLLLLVLLSCWFLPKTVSAQEISMEYFQDSLSPYGTWIRVADYGDCWQPYVDDPDWSPYTLGNWAYTDQGWLWVSDEPFGWATYHYGRWINLEGRGWCWVPGYAWAPAWVSWRYGDGYCGWAPMPPPRFAGEVGPGWYNFCPASAMGESSLRVVIINRNYNYQYVRRTNVINAYISIGNARIYSGPPILEVNRYAVRRPVPRYTIERNVVVRDRYDNFHPQPNGGKIVVYAPPVRRENSPSPRPYPSAQVRTPVVNDGRNVYRPPAVGPYAVPSAVPQQNRAANASVYKHEPVPQPQPSRIGPVQSQPQPQPRPQPQQQVQAQPQAQPQPQPQPQRSQAVSPNPGNPWQGGGAPSQRGGGQSSPEGHHGGGHR
ncbi:MAG: hypothetical protein B9S32_00430 [Verrucomicrobia bacterium Tous-C9LFEB]|nr:MAG: hypothetical protein B9S32_00430 [Verrucomicrobia bacterium Tous-C9LFEB]